MAMIGLSKIHESLLSPKLGSLHLVDPLPKVIRAVEGSLHMHYVGEHTPPASL